MYKYTQVYTQIYGLHNTNQGTLIDDINLCILHLSVSCIFPWNSICSSSEMICNFEYPRLYIISAAHHNMQ